MASGVMRIKLEGLEEARAELQQLKALAEETTAAVQQARELGNAGANAPTAFELREWARKHDYTFRWPRGPGGALEIIHHGVLVAAMTQNLADDPRELLHVLSVYGRDGAVQDYSMHEKLLCTADGIVREIRSAAQAVLP